MATVAEANEQQLRDTDGFLVESPEGDVGWVEAVWVDGANQPRALTVQTTDGRHALLLEEEVVTVDREQRWVVVPSRPALLELDPPRLTTAGAGDGSGRRIATSWATTGTLLPASARSWWTRRSRFPRPRPLVLVRDGAERPLWQVVALLYASIAFVVAFVITLVFVIARLVSGAAY